MYKNILFFCLFSFVCAHSQKSTSNTNKLDSILNLRVASRNATLDLSQRLSYAEEAIILSRKLKQDTTLLKSKRNLSSIFLSEGNNKSLREINFDILDLALKIKDTSSIANANFILGYAYDQEFKLDSAYYYYYQAHKYFDAFGKTERSISMLYSMAEIQNTERDYIGSEINALIAIKKLENLPEADWTSEQLWSMYNLIGIGAKELKNYDKAIKEYENSLKFTKKIENGYYYNLYSLNNIASLYIKKGDYKTAIEKFNEMLSDKAFKKNDSLSYSSVIGNLAYSKFLDDSKNDKEIYSLYRESLKISKLLGEQEIFMATSAYFSEFLESRNQLDSAIYFANKAYTLSKKSKNNNFILKSLILKSNLIKDSSSQFLNEHIKLNDSLITAERSIRNKFARIDRETDTIIQEKDVISKQRFWLTITSIALLITLLSLYVIKTQREKNKELQLAQQQQQANEEIYNLMLIQQDKMDEARALEKKRISQEIHDGILGRLFGARLSLDSLNMIKTDEAITNRENYIHELKDIEQDIRKVSHDLNTDFIANASFESLITTLVETQCLAYGLENNLSYDERLNWELLTNKTKIHLYRIIQESLQNIYKHAKANLVIIAIKQENNLISLAINDDGVGFDSIKGKDGIGLKNMKSRAREINGNLVVTSKKNRGTTIKIDVPI